MLLPDSALGLSEILWQHELSHIYLGSPSILRLPNGSLLVTADRFGDGFRGQPRNVSVHLSNDDGAHWTHNGWVTDQYCACRATSAQTCRSRATSAAGLTNLRSAGSNLFTLKPNSSSVYLLGTSTDGPAPIKIARSDDAGSSWPHAAVLHGQVSGAASYETGPTPTLVSGGRVYRAFERLAPPFRWGVDYEAVVLHADARADLLDPASWSLSAPLPFNASWIPTAWPVRPAAPGFLEGNMVEGPDGELYDLLRLDSKPAPGNFAVLLRLDRPANALRFDAIVRLPGGHSKFVVRRDARTGLYVTLSNPNDHPRYTDQRNVLALCTSKDLRVWTRHATLLRDDTGFAPDDSVRFTGFHYVDWQFDWNGRDLIAAVRTAYRGAVSYHNSNRITFKRVREWRSLL